ncbi:MAG TPA: YceI family protein [Candidatus Limnocylindria bacterium]|jgi:polyisoprenoid-binding protein YceI|nr:YceI family protein [Candidatus Limnocylindria bacterium]
MLMAWVSPGPAAPLYQIDQRYGTVEFSVSTLGMFDVEGRFPKFEGHLMLDPEHPEGTRIDVAISADAVEMPLPDQVELLRSAAYFDTVNHPVEHFASTAIRVISPSHYVIQGTLQIRGVTQPQLLDAVLKERHLDQKTGVETADFVVTGEIKRSAFGMVADRTMLSDSVHLRIRIRLALSPAANG